VSSTTVLAPNWSLAALSEQPVQHPTNSASLVPQSEGEYDQGEAHYYRECADEWR
jgi:hypothetical protein